MPFDLDIRDTLWIPLALLKWRDAAPKRRVVLEHALVGGAETVTLFRGVSRAHFPSVSSAVDGLSTPERRAKIAWLRDGRGDGER